MANGKPMMMWLGGLVLAVLGFLATPALGQTTSTAPAQPAYKNLALSFEERAADLAGRMTLAEKAAQVQMEVAANGRLGVPAWHWWSEALHGVGRAGSATVYPHASALAATWDPPLLNKIAAATADEMRAKYDPSGERYYGLTVWAPAINLTRDPRWGRVQECYGEDPYLTARLGVAYCKGLQGDDPKYLKTVATPKHFAAHSHESSRTTGSAMVSERVLRDYYLPAFQACFAEAQAGSVMVALSGINKVPCGVNSWLMEDVLRKDWGFRGAVVTDLRGISSLQEGHNLFATSEEAVAAALKAGVDVMCEQRSYAPDVVRAVKTKLLPEDVLTRAVTRNLTLRFRLGIFDPPERVAFARTPRSVIGCQKHLDLALQSARESIVLLQNDPAPPGHGFEHLLPLDLRKVSTLAVLGPYATVAQLGNYSGDPSQPPVTPLEGLQAACGDRIKVVTADPENDEESVQAAKQADLVVLVLGLGERMEAEGFDRKTLELPLKQIKFLQKIRAANPLIVLVLQGGSPITLGPLRGQVPAVLETWYPGQRGGTALAEVLLGQQNPSGRLPFTVYASLDDVGPLNEYEIETGRTYLYCAKPVDYAFGHGLSYTTFEYANLRLEPAEAKASDRLVVTCDVKNAGTRAGDEVVQLYVHKTQSPLKRPLKQLKAFARVNIPLGETRPVRFELPVQELAFWDVPAHKYVVEAGAYEIMVGGSSADVRVRATIAVK